MIDYFHSSGNSSLFQIELIRLWISEWILVPPSLISYTEIWPVRGDLCLLSFKKNHLKIKAIGPGNSGCAVWISACLRSLTPCIFNNREMVPPPSQNTVTVCNQITLPVLYYISSRLVTLLKVADAPIWVSVIFYRIVSFKFINFSFQLFLLYVPEMATSFTTYVVYIIDIVSLWIL